MFLRRTLSLFFLSGLASASSAEHQDSGHDGQPSCVSPEETAKFYHKYHSPNTCGKFAAFPGGDMAAMQQERQVHFQRLRDAGHHHRVPDFETVVCPTTVEPLATEHDVIGLNTVWVVENAASTRVVLSWVDSATGKEYSAMDARIEPPQADPNAILQPGEDAVVYSFEGHVFYARELDDDGVAGEVLMQHKVGLIPVGTLAKDVKCEVVAVETDDEEEDPVYHLADALADAAAELYSRMTAGAVATKTKAQGFASHVGSLATAVVGIPIAFLGAGYDALMKKPGSQLAKKKVMKAVDPEPDKTTAHKFTRKLQPKDEPKRECNGLEVGFRNRSPCPLHASWVNARNNCAENFRFHLGVEALAAGQNFAWNWTSQTKFESSFMGHQYVFRLAADPSQVVDTIILQPTRIIDCPDLKRGRVGTGTGEAVGVGVPQQAVALNETCADDLQQESSTAAHWTAFQKTK